MRESYGKSRRAGFEALHNFVKCFETGNRGKTRKIDYIISLDTARRIAMLERNEQFSNWIRDWIYKYGFQAGFDFTVNKFINGE